MDCTLEHKTAVVTGGGTGIGRAIARRLAEAGARVAVAGRRREPLEETAQQIRDAGHTCLVQLVDVSHRSFREDPGSVRFR